MCKRVRKYMFIRYKSQHYILLKKLICYVLKPNNCATIGFKEKRIKIVGLFNNYHKDGKHTNI